MKEFAPKGSKFFPFRVGPFSEGRLGSKFFPFRVASFSEGKQNIFDRVAFPESIHSP